MEKALEAAGLNIRGTEKDKSERLDNLAKEADNLSQAELERRINEALKADWDDDHRHHKPGVAASGVRYRGHRYAGALGPSADSDYRSSNVDPGPKLHFKEEDATLDRKAPLIELERALI
jgi:hypothetical protein